MKKMTEEMYQAFLELASSLSPENLSCDGECSPEQADRRYRALMKVWRKNEAALGRKVTEEEIWDENMRRYEKEHPLPKKR